VNYVDVFQRDGRAEVPKPYTPGLEGVEWSVNGSRCNPDENRHPRRLDQPVGLYAEQIVFFR